MCISFIIKSWLIIKEKQGINRNDLVDFANPGKGSATVESWTQNNKELEDKIDQMFFESDLAIHAIMNKILEKVREDDRHLRELPGQEQPIPADHSGNGEGSTSPDQFDGTSTPLVA